MPKINYQFYTFNEEHFAVPLSLPISDEKRSWSTVTSYIQQLLEYPPDNPEMHPKECIIVLLAGMKDLHNEQTYRNLTIPVCEDKKPVRYIKEAGKGLQNPGKFDEHQLRQARPILLVATEDIMELFGEAPGVNLSESTWRYQYRLDLDARIKFWDSGIWHQYVPIDGRGDTEEYHFGTRFLKTFQKMEQWYEQGLYATFVALENLEFQTRLMQHSFIADIGHHGHETRVTPFKFHSEAVMARMSAQIISDLTAELIQQFKWRLLLVDDYAISEVSSLDKRCKISKLTLIHEILHQELGQESGIFEIIPPKPKNKQAEEKEVVSEIINHSITMMQQNTYDVILLDYLLGAGEMERTGREYGYDFLRELIHRITTENTNNLHKGPMAGIDNPERARKITEDTNNLHKGPMGRFWVFPISSFPFAFADKLRQLGMDGFSDHWYLSGGGDPICTPELFRYNFLNVIKQQISACYLHPHALKDFFNRFSGINNNGILWRDLVLNAIESIHLNKSVLENDETQGSLFAQTMLSFIRNNDAYKTKLNQMKSFVANIMEIPYFKIDIALQNLEVSEKKALKQKSAMFFRPEEKLEKQIQKHSGNTFNFDGERLRWLPATIDKIAEVEVLRLGNNQLKMLPIELTSLQNLRQLDLSYNHLETLPKSMRALTRLEYLDLTGNPNLPEYLRIKHEGKKEIQELFANAASWDHQRRKKIVVSYANQEKNELLELEKILNPLERAGLISFWTDNQILPGQEWNPEIQGQFQQADIILLLVSASFLASDYIHNVEMNIAIERHAKGECQIVPIILKECDWQHDPLKKFQALPKGIRPVYSPHRASPDEAWKEVSEGIRKVIKSGRLS